MNTLELKKEMVSTLKNELQIEVNVRESLEALLNEYIDFIKEEVSSEFRRYFGIGIAGSHSQFGSHYGFFIERDYQDCYAVPGQGYCIANDFDAKVTGSNFFEMKEFAKNIPLYVKKGIEKLKAENKETMEIINKIQIS